MMDEISGTVSFNYINPLHNLPPWGKESVSLSPVGEIERGQKIKFIFLNRVQTESYNFKNLFLYLFLNIKNQWMIF